MTERFLGRSSTFAALHGLLSLLPDNGSAAERNAAALSLVVNLRDVAPSTVLQTLQCLVTMESCSHVLQRYPLVKQAFWEQILASDLMIEGFKIHRQQLQLQDKQFPRLVLDFSRCLLTTELLETLTEFFTQSQTMQPLPHPQFSRIKLDKGEMLSCRLVPVALRLIRCRLSADLITRLTKVLVCEQWMNDSSVRFCVTSLDLSENAMQSDELMALAALLNECKRPRQRCSRLPFDELLLENALSRSITTKYWTAFRAFVCAAVGVNGDCKASLKRLSLAKNSLSYRYIGCICSALRCESTALEELSLASTFSLVNPADRKACYQWLAIGLRPSKVRGTSGLRLLDLSGNPLFPMESKAWRESLCNPQATVLQWLDDAASQPVSSRTTTVYCLLSANTELYSSPIEASPRLQDIETEVKALSLGAHKFIKWEVLAFLAENHDWLCIVVPGFGLAWTRAKYAMIIQHTEESISWASAVLSKLVMNDMTGSRTTSDALRIFVGGFGEQLQSLELRRNALSAVDLVLILDGCQPLDTVDVENCRIHQLQSLIDGLSGTLGQHLRILNLNANLIGAESLGILTAALHDQEPDCIPFLQELRVANNEIGANGVRHLHAALEVNKKLMLLELDLPKDGAEAPRRPDDDEYIQLYRMRCMRLDASFQNELLDIAPLPPDRMFAFLLVLNAHNVVLDRGIYCTIFSFASDEKRRRILWNTAHAS